LSSGHYESIRDLLDAFDRRALAAFREVEAQIKADGTPVTRVDHETSEEVQAALQARFPDHGILSEENPEPHRPEAEWQWVLDPLDGTAMFARGFPVWGIGIGLMRGAEPREGYLSFPVLGERYGCAEGVVYRNGRVVPPPAAPPPQMRCILVGSEIIQELPLQRIRALKMRNFGTNLYHLVAVAMGHAEAMISPRSFLWDLAPALPFTRARGLVERYLDGTPFALEPLCAPQRRTKPLAQPLLVGRAETVAAILRDLA
jgi:fructose-1,6-bisphosphatase/inositol monophosphatase family enzyme